MKLDECESAAAAKVMKWFGSNEGDVNKSYDKSFRNFFPVFIFQVHKNTFIKWLLRINKQLIENVPVIKCGLTGMELA